MQEFFLIILSFPTILFTFLLGFVCVYWLIAALGLIDIGSFDMDVDVEVDMDASPNIVAGMLYKLGWDGIPVMFILSPLAFFSWIFSFLGTYFILLPISLAWLYYGVGCIVFVVSLLLAVPVTGRVVRMLKPLFKTHKVKDEAQSWLGRTVVIRSSIVNEEFGEAYLDLDGHAKKVIEVRTWKGTEFKTGDQVILAEYQPSKHAFYVVAKGEFIQ